jgi:DNA-binding XRE family transcriptional regulator
MSQDQVPYNKLVKAKESVEPAKRRPKKPMVISDDDTRILKLIAAKAKELREKAGYTYEEFAIHAGINRNTYFRFEKSAITGDNYTITLLLKITKGLNISIMDFFQQIT